MNQRIQLYVLGAVALVLAFVIYSTYFGSSGTTAAPGITAADTTFHPLDIQEPQLRMDLLDRIQKSEYSGTHRNVFIAAPPPPPPKPPGEQSASLFVGPRVPPPPPPLQVPGEFFGYASASGSGRRIAFFKNGDDLQLLAEGDTF